MEKTKKDQLNRIRKEIKQEIQFINQELLKHNEDVLIKETAHEIRRYLIMADNEINTYLLKTY
jgi:hypothetical protein